MVCDFLKWFGSELCIFKAEVDNKLIKKKKKVWLLWPPSQQAIVSSSSDAINMDCNLTFKHNALTVCIRMSKRMFFSTKMSTVFRLWRMDISWLLQSFILLQFAIHRHITSVCNTKQGRATSHLHLQLRFGNHFFHAPFSTNKIKPSYLVISMGHVSVGNWDEIWS